MGWVSRSLFPYQKSIPTHEKLFAVGKKVAQRPLFNLIFFLGWGWPWVGEFDGFIIIFICFPTQQNSVVSQTPYTRHIYKNYGSYYVPGNINILRPPCLYSSGIYHVNIYKNACVDRQVELTGKTYLRFLASPWKQATWKTDTAMLIMI